MERLSLKAGYCLTESGSSCTFEKSECGADDTVVVPWRSAGEMRGAPYTAHGGYCLLAKTVREMTLGRCGGQCAPNAASCGVAANVFETHYDCKMKEVTFGRCGAARCSWSPAACRADEEWTFPAAGCSYDRVRVGACDEGGGVLYCAVSEDGCSAGSAYLNPLEVAAQAGTECYVGMAATVPIEEQPLRGVKASAASAEGAPEYTSKDGVIIGAAAVGGALVVALLGYGLVSLHRKKKKAAAEKKEHVFQTNDFENPPSPQE